jgi:hypothetical protein
MRPFEVNETRYTAVVRRARQRPHAERPGVAIVPGRPRSDAGTVSSPWDDEFPDMVLTHARNALSGAWPGVLEHLRNMR